MNPSRPVPTSESAAQPLVYRPLSPPAVAAFVAAVLYALLVAVLGGVAFATGSPLLLPAWMLVIPITAAALGVVALWLIRQAEGTRSGAGLARWAVWLSALFGLGYAAIAGGTYLAVRLQSGKFTRDWIADVHEGKLAKAFLLTRDPADRKGVNPDKAEDMRRWTLPSTGHKGELPRFEDSELVRVLRHAGPDLHIESLGIRDWEPKEGPSGVVYHVENHFRFTTPEGVFNAAFDVWGLRGKDYTGRQWMVNWENTKIVEKELSPYGEALAQWAEQAAAFVNDWLDKRKNGDWPGFYLDTQEPARRGVLRAEESAVGLGAALAELGSPAHTPASLTALATLANPQAGPGIFWPGYPEVVAGKFVRTDRFSSADETPDKDFLQGFSNGFRSPVMIMRASPRETGRPLLPRKDDGAPLRVAVTVDVAFINPAKPAVPAAQGSGEVVVSSDPGPLTSDRRPRWHVVSLEFLTARKTKSTTLQP